jgi:hypothetical protein
MPVVPAGVHPARNGRRVGGVRLFVQRQAIHVGAKKNPATRSVRRRVGNDSGPPDSAARGESRRRQPLGDDLRGSGFFEGELRMAVKVAARLDEPLHLGGRKVPEELLERGHVGGL